MSKKLKQEISEKIKSAISGYTGQFEILSGNIIKLLNSPETERTDDFRTALREAISLLTSQYGVQGAINFLRHYEISEGMRKPSLAIYDHAFHFIGGAQKYGLTLVKALEDTFDITIIANRDITHKDFMDWYSLDLSKTEIKIIRLPYFDNRDTSHIDPHRIMKGTSNPFHTISRESGNYDIFINNGMLEMVYPLSLISVLVCHFPERRPQSYFYSDNYTYTIFNSKYTEQWIKKRWKYTPHKHIYPPVDMEVFRPGDKKEKIILSVARLEEGGTKKQKEMASAFITMKEKYPDITNGWKLIIAGGSTGENIYIRELEEIIGDKKDNSIELKINISDNELKELYKRSSVFWHLCGLGQNDPAKVEHFGMTIGEAMQNRIAPIVFDGGGQREIVEHGISGFRISSLSGLINYTINVMGNREFLEKLGKGAYEKSSLFKRERFVDEVRTFFYNIFPGFSNQKS